MKTNKNVTLFGDAKLYRLESVTWVKPGKTRVTISAICEGTAGLPSVPKTDAYVDLGIDLRFVECSQRFDGGVMYCLWHFECGLDSLSSPTDRQNDNVRGEQWGMSVDLMQIPIAQHPKASDIMKSHGGIIKEGEIVFGRYFNNKKNPYYGVSAFYFPSVTLEVQCIMPGIQGVNEGSSGSISFDQVDQVGRNDTDLASPKGNLSGFSFISTSAANGRKPWLLISHTVRQAGNERLETKTWRWGGVAGWLDAIYDPDWKYTGTATQVAKMPVTMGAA